MSRKLIGLHNNFIASRVYWTFLAGPVATAENVKISSGHNGRPSAGIGQNR